MTAQEKTLAGLVERLRNPNFARSQTFAAEYMREAASAITTLSAEVERLGRERDAYERASLEQNMLAYKWMTAHDALRADRPYEYPNPVDLPNAIARAETAERDLATAKAALEVKDRALEPFAAEAAEWSWKFSDDQQVSCRPGPPHDEDEVAKFTVGHLRAARAARAHGGDHA